MIAIAASSAARRRVHVGEHFGGGFGAQACGYPRRCLLPLRLTYVCCVCVQRCVGAESERMEEMEEPELVDREETVEELLGAEPEVEPEGEDMFGEDFARDYMDRPELDTYDVADLDQTAYAPLTMKERIRAEERIAAREKERVS